MSDESRYQDFYSAAMERIRVEGRPLLVDFFRGLFDDWPELERYEFRITWEYDSHVIWWEFEYFTMDGITFCVDEVSDNIHYRGLHREWRRNAPCWLSIMGEYVDTHTISYTRGADDFETTRLPDTK